jgi:Class III cytochrome C family/Cytochrome c554 and c-prime
VKGRWLWIVIGANLVVLVALAFVYPHLMVAPGALVDGHAELTTDCFACHAPLRGATADRCVACHKLPDIGLRTTQGAAIVTAKPVKASFHQSLNEPDCMACHSDHAGPKLTHRSRKPFSHAMLRVATRDQCDTCHAAPTNALHQALSVNCGQCHTTGAWKPATFDHDKLFPLDKDHNASCVTCHVGNNYQRYTCYGCHEHTPANMLAKHRKEGVTESLDNCVRCHRSASGEVEGKGDRGKGRRDRD